VSLAVLEILAFNTHNLQGHVTVTTPPVRNFFRDNVGTFPGSMHAKVEVRILDILELLAFDAQNLWVRVTLATPTVQNFFRGHIRTVRGNMLAKFQLRIFSHFGAIRT